MIKKIFLGVGILIVVTFPSLMVISCDGQKTIKNYFYDTPNYIEKGNYFIGPRGGTYTISPSGNRHYFGHNGY